MFEFDLDQKVADFIRELDRQWPRVMDVVMRIELLRGGTGISVTNGPHGVGIAAINPRAKSTPTDTGDNEGSPGGYFIPQTSLLVGGMYLGQQWAYDFSGVDPSSDTTFDAIGAVTGPTVVIVNEAERGQTTHGLVQPDIIGTRHWCTPTGATFTIDETTYDIWVTDSYTSKASCNPS